MWCLSFPVIHSFIYVEIEFTNQRVPWWFSGLRIWHCHCCGTDLIPDLETSACCRHSQYVCVCVCIWNSYIYIWNSVLLSIVIRLHNHHYYLIPEHSRTFLQPWKETPYLLTNFPLSSFYPAPGNCYLLSVSTDLLILDISYKRNHTVCGFFSLTCF